MSLTPEQTKLKEAFIATLGEKAYNLGWEDTLKHSPEYFRASLKLHSVPKTKKHLSPKIQALIALTVDCNATHLYPPGVQLHMQNALAAGATKAEIAEIIELSSTLGIHACNIGVPLLVEVMKEEGVYEKHTAAGKYQMDEKREKLKADFTKNRGYWHTFWEDFLKLDPEFFDAYLEFSSVSWVKDVKGESKGGGALEPKVR